MLIFTCCIAFRETKSRLCMQVLWLPALEEQWISLFLLAGEQLRGFCSLPASTPRVLLRVCDWVAKAFSVLSFHSMLETTQKAAHLSRFGNKHAGEAYPVCTVCCRLQQWNDGAWDKETMVMKTDPLQKTCLPIMRNQLRFHCPKHWRDWSEWRSRSYLVIPGLHFCWPRGQSAHKLPQSLWKWDFSSPFQPKLFGDEEDDDGDNTLNPDTVRHDKAMRITSCCPSSHLQLWGKDWVKIFITHIILRWQQQPHCWSIITIEHLCAFSSTDVNRAGYAQVHEHNQ